MTANENEFEEEVIESESQEKETRDLTLSFLSAGKWSNQQTISFLDFSSLDGTISTVFKILSVFLLVLLFKKKK